MEKEQTKRWLVRIVMFLIVMLLLFSINRSYDVGYEQGLYDSTCPEGEVLACATDGMAYCTVLASNNPQGLLGYEPLDLGIEG